MPKRFSFLVLLSALVLALTTLSARGEDDGSVLKKLKNIATVASTLPTNQDVNPYGVAVVPRSIGNLHERHILISNFNAASNFQGTGTTIVDVAPNGATSLFAQINASTLPGPCPGGVGLTTALAVLRTGWVIVGSLPTTDGMADTAQAGCLVVLDSMGNVAETIYGSLINGPWDMASLDGDKRAALFVTNVLNGTVAANQKVVNEGTVVRINLEVSERQMPFVESITVIGSGFAEHSDPTALVVGPTGVGLASDGDADDGGFSCRDSNKSEQTLYVADTVNNRIAAISDPLCRRNSDGTGVTVSAGGSLNSPLGLAISPGGHILVVNGGDGYITEITPGGKQIAKTLLDSSGSPAGAGALFGLAFSSDGILYFVDDATNTLDELH